MAGSQALLQVSQIIVAVVLARLLAPHDYGVAGMVLVFSTLGLVYLELALGSALVQRADPTDATAPPSLGRASASARC